MSPVVEALKEDYGDQLRLVYRHFPLITIHDKAQITAEAAEAAGAQGMFWEMHDILFERQSAWNSVAEGEITETLVAYGEELGLDVEQFRTDLEERTYKEKVDEAYKVAGNANLSGTPSFVINQVDYPSESFGLSYEGLDVFIKLMGLRGNGLWFSEPEQVIDPNEKYIATIETEKGNIVLELYPDTAPINVNSFAFLAEQGWYKNTTFHRVLPDFVAQGGDPTNTGVGFPGYRCGDEVVASRTFDGPGVVSLANSGPDSNGGQFFITYGVADNLNDGFTIIGRVIEGQDVVDSITPRNPQDGSDLPTGDAIINITVEKKS
jgi:cyclophilin family peptidyl-prolyl cis-trans isomerase